MELNRKEIKKEAKSLIKDHYWTGVFAGMVLIICATDSFLFSNNSGITFQSDTGALFPSISEFLNFVTSAQFFYSATFVLFMTFFFSVFVGNPMQYGARNWFYHHCYGEDEEDKELFSGFRKPQWLRVSACILWRDLICICWGILLIFPGIMKQYEYKFVPYILEEHPLMNAADVLKTSSNLTKGHKMELFKLDLSFIGWFLLQIITFDFVGFFYAGPYFYHAQALAYAKIKESVEEERKTEAQKNYKKSRKNH